MPGSADHEDRLAALLILVRRFSKEVGKRSAKTEEAFLKGIYKRMVRTMLRYAIERFPEPRRRAFLKGEI